MKNEYGSDRRQRAPKMVLRLLSEAGRVGPCAWYPDQVYAFILFISDFQMVRVDSPNGDT